MAIKKIVLPSSLVSIGNYAFKNVDQCTEITFANESTSQLASIGEGAFSFCYSLAHFFLPSGVTRLPQYCFYHCDAFGAASLSQFSFNDSTSALVETSGVSIPTEQRDLYGKNASGDYARNAPNITKIGEGAFAFCPSLRRFICPSKLDFIDNMAFKQCTGLISFEPNSLLRKIGDYCFQNDTAFQTLASSDPTNFPLGGSCDFSYTACPYLEDVGISIFKDCWTIGLAGITYPRFFETDDSGVFDYAYGWCLAIREAYSKGTAFRTQISFSFKSGTIGLARDVLKQIPGNHKAASYSNSSDHDSSTGIQVTLNQELIYASNNFIRFSGDDYQNNGMNTINTANISGKNGLAFTSLVHPAGLTYSYTAVTIASGNQHFQILDVSGAGTGTALGAALPSVDYSYQHLVNFYAGYSPEKGKSIPEARLITSTRYAHWNAGSTFGGCASVLASGGGDYANLFTTLNGYNGKKANGESDEDCLIENYTTLSAESGQGTQCLYNGSFRTGDILSYTGKKNNSTITVTNTAVSTASSLPFTSVNDTASYPNAFTAVTGVTTIGLSVTANGFYETGSDAANTLSIIALNGTTELASTTLAFTSLASATVTGTITLQTASSVTGFKTTYLSKKNLRIYITTIQAALNAGSTTTKTLNSFTNWTRSVAVSGSGISNTNNPQAFVVFNANLRRLEDRVFEGGYVKDTGYLYFFLSTNLLYVGRELVAGNLITQISNNKTTCLMQDATISENWNPLFNVAATYSSSLTTSNYMFWGASASINGVGVWSL